MLTKRDKSIIKDLHKFSVMDRDSIAELHFANLKNPQQAANNVLLRLMRDGQIQRSTSFVPYVYFPSDSHIKKNSQKINHFLAILNTYKEIKKLGAIETFLVEPKYSSKGTVEPDAYLKYRSTGFFLEIQKSIYTEKQMLEKINRYLDFYHTGIMAVPFPHVLILSEQRYGIDGDYPFKIFQADSFTNFVKSLQQKVLTHKKDGSEIKIKIG